ncbi:unnamed protein product, partial [Dicrocoelium dendriticum]
VFAFYSQQIDFTVCFMSCSILQMTSDREQNLQRQIHDQQVLLSELRQSTPHQVVYQCFGGNIFFRTTRDTEMVKCERFRLMDPWLFLRTLWSLCPQTVRDIFNIALLARAALHRFAYRSVRFLHPFEVFLIWSPFTTSP